MAVSERFFSSSELEDTFVNRSAIYGLGIVRHDLGSFEELPELPLAEQTSLMESTGSRPWCIVTPAKDAPWQNVLEGITADKFLIHMLEVSLEGRELSVKESTQLKQYIRNEMDEIHSSQFTIYKNGKDKLIITSEDIHLTNDVTAKLMQSIEDWLAINPPIAPTDTTL